MFLGDLHHSFPGDFVKQLRLCDEYFLFGSHQTGQAVVAFLFCKLIMGTFVTTRILSTQSPVIALLLFFPVENHFQFNHCVKKFVYRNLVKTLF